MNCQNDILAVILARGGSKTIPKKNIYPVCGKPLIYWTINEALKSDMISDLVVSSDDDEILKIAKESGAKTIKRPDELSQDATWSRDALKHAVLEMEKKRINLISIVDPPRIIYQKYDYVIELPCTVPLRNYEDINNALNKLINTECDSVISVCRVYDKHPVRMKKIINDQIMDFCTEFPEGEGSRKQDLQECYIRNGAIYSMKRDVIVEQFSRNGKDSRPYIMPEERSVNIDTMFDMEIAKLLIEKRELQKLINLNKFPPDNNIINSYSPIKVYDVDKLSDFLERPIKFWDPIKNNNPNILITCPTHFFTNKLNELENKFNITHAYNQDLSYILSLSDIYEILITNPGDVYKIDKEIIDHFSNLKHIISPSTGTNHIDVNYCKEKGIKVHCLLDNREFLNTISSSAEFTFLLMMSLIRKLPLSINTTKIGYWRQIEDLLRGKELEHKKVSIIGFGRIGKKLKKYCESFNMYVYTHDKDNNKERLDYLLSISDIVFCCLNLTDETKDFFNKDLFNKMKQNSYFINTSRGEIVNEDDLINALETKKLYGAAVDVVNNETNYKQNKLIEYSKFNPNLIVTPHIAGLSYESQSKAFDFVINKLNELYDINI